MIKIWKFLFSYYNNNYKISLKKIITCGVMEIVCTLFYNKFNFGLDKCTSSKNITNTFDL